MMMFSFNISVKEMAMKKWITVFFLCFSAMTLVAGQVEAKRFGGGSSIGKRSAPMSQKQSASPQKNATDQKTTNTATAKPSPMKGILGGLMGGLLLGGLLSSLGLGAGLSGFLGTVLTVLLGFFAIRFLMGLFNKPTVATPQGQPISFEQTPQHSTQRVMVDAAKPSNAFASTLANEPNALLDFDEPAFLKQMKIYFMQMQAAWDAADAKSIYEFTDPALYAELRVQLQERGETPNFTDVKSLSARLLNHEFLANGVGYATVQFDAMIQEDRAAQPQSVAEIWHMSKASDQDTWRLMGIDVLDTPVKH
jgi:predicted lipid-binding transport protein (Tim44 family)